MSLARRSLGTRRSRAAALALSVAAAAAVTAAAPVAATATAASTTPTATHAPSFTPPDIAQVHAQRVAEVIHEAREQAGKPYRYGADGPSAFDCSGLVRYVFEHSVHVSLPHNAAAQYASIMHISRENLKVGDLIFTDNGGYISHVGIYAGDGYWWVAPQTGQNVQKQRIYHAHFKYGRVLRYTAHV